MEAARKLAETSVIIHRGVRIDKFSDLFEDEEDLDSALLFYPEVIECELYKIRKYLKLKR